MKKILFCLILIIASVKLHAQDMRVGTYNLRLLTNSDVGNLWKDRSPAVVSLIRFHDFDILGTQEAFKSQLDDVLKALPQYSVYGKGREDGKDAGEHSAIFYKAEKFEVLDKGDFWLSETPEKPGLGWDATCCNRICSWLYLKDNKSKKKFYVFNAHYDHQGVIARRESSKLILEKIKQIAGTQSVIFMGDLNGNHESEPYQIIENNKILKDTYQLVENPYAVSSSFNGFGPSLKGQVSIIDHVFVSKDFSVKKWGVLTDSYQGKYPSDHFPIFTVLQFEK